MVRILLAVFLVAAFSTTTVVASPIIEWARQLGTSSDDESNGVSADRLGNVFISGYTEGNLAGQNWGLADAFLSKYDAAGALQWTRQLSSSGYDNGFEVAADGLGNVYISGVNRGWPGGGGRGGLDAFVSKYDSAGTRLWTRQVGTSSEDGSYGLTTDGLGSIYLTGYTRGALGGANAGTVDAFVSKISSAGTIEWSRQFGTSRYDIGRSVAADGLGNVYITGSIESDAPEALTHDVFVRKYNAAGTLLWTRDFGTSLDDIGFGIAADGLGNVFVTGYTEVRVSNVISNRNGFIKKYDQSGMLVWTQDIATPRIDDGYSVVADGLGNVYLSGYTAGDLGGSNAGSFDPFVSMYDATGLLLWTQQFGTVQTDYAFGLTTDGRGALYLSGSTRGNLGGPNAGGYDAFLVKLSEPVPEPSALALMGIAGAVAGIVQRRRLLA